MATTAVSQEQELIPQNYKNGSYGSNDPELQQITIDKASKRSTFFQYGPCILSAIACIVSIVVAIVVISDKNNSTTSNNEAFTTSSNAAAIGYLGRALILSQFALEQRIRSQGDSGLTNVRSQTDGDDVFDDNTYTNGAAAAIHDHSNTIRIMGMGELQAVLNGVEFQTRHNDYELNMPSTTSDEYGAYDRVPFPDVPPEVLAAGDVSAQIQEMQEWFRAFKTQNRTHRDYTKYFKPVLCYLEGTWVLDDGALEDGFDSDRHQIDAATWRELHDKIRFMSNSGRKDILENLAHLPMSIRNLQNDSYPIISNWEYRIMCHPLEHDVPLARLRIADDVSVQLFQSPLSRDELWFNRRVRFELAKYVNVTDPSGELYGQEESYPDGYWLPGIKYWNYMDFLMEGIPGKDNYGANLTEEVPGFQGLEKTIHYIDGSEVNAGYYSRFFQISIEDAMGTRRQRRSFNDRYMWAAMTTQEKVSPVDVYFGEERYISRFSYAIPLELNYLTPLQNWNPYNVQYIDGEDFPQNVSGSCSENQPFPGWWELNSYFTPSAFFSSDAEAGNGDTPKSDICVLDENGESQSVFASGNWITFPRIGGGVGYVRSRFPVFPLHGAATPAFNEVKGLQAILLDDDYDDPTNGVPFFGDQRDRIYGFDIMVSGGGHDHTLHVPGWAVTLNWYDEVNGEYYNGSDYTVVAETDIANGHEHTIVTWRYKETTDGAWIYVIDECKFGTENGGGTYLPGRCADGHTTLARGYV
eukprot:CAMPEP_0197052852 /NCGR_PEP_ID=MMETSP1384-20130603/27249_1 /TAXON_ID=29189 /ORGANISM="Ammonia sp." /LENGTH=751 /DNA_ID=CAMNT_0042485663 /DNA_START=34 /DNA_END=2289 /DNA_ORIENTATION=+